MAALLLTKLYVPPVRPELVSRPRLIERLNVGLLGRRDHFARKLTLVSAPAGFGKTTLVSEWLSGVERPVAWLSLDEEDNDPVRFSTYLIAALQTVDPNVGQAAQAMLQSPQPPPPEPFLASLINDVAGTPSPFVLVLDDYHLIHTLPIHRQLIFLLEHQPPQIHLVIASREDPPLSLSRLRARGQMVDVRQAELRFTGEETSNFLQRIMRLDLTAAEVATLHQRTEGWIAGLQLVALSMQGSADVRRLVASFAGDHRYVLDYLMDEVFAQQPADVQDFLLKTSILERFSAPLCDAVAGRDDSRGVLLSLERSNLFIIPLDQSRQWYRYHRLFADLLRHRLSQSPPFIPPARGGERGRVPAGGGERGRVPAGGGERGRVPAGGGERQGVKALHRQASRWYAENGFPADAVRHALAASDWEEAASLIVSVSGDMLKRGEVVTLLGWYWALPDEMVLADPQLCLEYSWPLILTERIEAAEPYLAHAEQVALEHEIRPLLGGIAIAKAHVARLRGDNAQVIELSEQALSLLPRDELSGRSIVALNLGLAQWHRGCMADAERALKEAQRAGRGSGNEYVRWTAVLFLNRIQTARGKSRQAAESYRQMIEQGGQLPIAGLAHFDLGRLSYEWNELIAAADCLQRGLEIVRRGGGVEFEAGGYSALAFIRQAQGDPAAAQAALQRADQLLENPGISPSTRLYNLASQVAVALGQGDLDAASRVVERFPKLEEAGSFPDYLLLMLAQGRVLLAQEQQFAAVEHLAALHAMASRAGWQSTITQTRALQALAAPTPEQARAFITEALTRAGPENYVRTFVDAGEPMRSLISDSGLQIKKRGEGADRLLAYVGRLLAAFDSITPRREPEVSDIQSPISNVVEPLSDRELDVLRLLADGQTNREIAQTLCVSINTVKTHLKNVYGKLGVGNRREAAASAKECGLIP
jgi:LuxR family maltose regulon positive regulatory protein